MSALVSLVVLLAASPALAQDDDDFLDDLFDEEEEEEELPDERERTRTDDEDDFTFDEEEDDGGFFLDEEEEIEGEVRAGQDTADIYRAFQRKVQQYEPEEELASWEEYLLEYPFSVFQDQIEARMDELGNAIYSERITGPGGGIGDDAMRQELDLAIPLLLENIDPRSKARVGFEWGFPAYLNLLVDLEYQVLRELSFHGGLRNRYTGWNAEAGVKYAPIKSTRTNTVVSGLLDFHLNTNPLFPALRPQLGVGQIFDIGGGLHVQAQGGVDLEFWGDPGMQVRYVGGANIYYAASETVGVFAETSTNMKHLGGQGDIGSFRFNIVTFGLRFQPGDSPARVGLSANVPYSSNYWAYHFGAVQGDMNYFLDQPGRYQP